jgi:peptidoglycan/LPS O-acetylase OafA/YrhL
MGVTSRAAKTGPIILHWFACLLSLLPIIFVIGTIVHEGSNPIGIIRSTGGRFLFFPIGVLFGFLLAWRWELLGSLVSLVSLALFYALHYIQSGRGLGGPNFLIFSLPALLFLGAWMWRRMVSAPVERTA